MADIQDQIKQRKAEMAADKLRRTRGEVFMVGDEKFRVGQQRELLDGTKVRTTKSFFGNVKTGRGSLYATRISDGKRIKVKPSDFKPAGRGAPGFVDEIKRDAPRGPNPYQETRNKFGDTISDKIDRGIIKTKDQLRNDPDYQKIKSNRIKNEMIRLLAGKGGDVSYKKVEKKVEPPKYDKRGNLLRAPGLSKDSSGVIQIQERLLAEEARDRRSMSPRAFFQKYGKKMASGGMVNASNGAFIEVQNRFLDRLLPGKKRTTRIY